MAARLRRAKFPGDRVDPARLVRKVTNDEPRRE
jgi:hypothetical protein